MNWSQSFIVVLGIFASIGLIVAIKLFLDLFQSVFAYFKDKIDELVHKSRLGEPLFEEENVVYHIDSDTSMFPYKVMKAEWVDDKGYWIYYIQSVKTDGRDSIWVCEDELSSENLFLKELLE